MNVKELREALNSLDERHDNHEFRIVIEDHIMGPVPTTRIKSMGVGIDWNKGQFLLFPEDKLQKINAQ